MKKHQYLITISLLALTVRLSYGQSQLDTMIVYNLKTKTIDTIPPVTFDSTTTFDKTTSYVGSLGNQVPLSLLPPTTNLFSNSNFSDIARAELFFNVTDYPIRTAVGLRGIFYNASYPHCSGIMIGTRPCSYCCSLYLPTSKYLVHWVFQC